MERKVFISADSQEYLDVLEMLTGFGSIACDTLLQSGATRIALEPQLPDIVSRTFSSLPNYLSKRVVRVRDTSDKYMFYSKLHKIFGISRISSKQNESEATDLAILLSDILFAAKTGLSVALVRQLPNYRNLEKELPPKIYYPIVNFFSCFQELSPKGPCFRKFLIEEQQAILLAEILESRLYEQYSKGHIELARAGASLEISHKISRSAQKLAIRYSDALRLRPIILKVLNIASPAAKTLLGPPGSLFTDLVRPVIQMMLDRNSSIIIYDISAISSLAKDALFKKKLNWANRDSAHRG